MRHLYLGRAFSLVLACAAFGCGDDEKKTDKSVKADGGTPGGEEGAVDDGINDAKPIDIKEIPKTKKMSDLEPGEIKGVCQATFELYKEGITGMCQEGALQAESPEACEETFESCAKIVSEYESMFSAEVCDSATTSETCSMTVEDFQNCLQERQAYFDALSCDSAGGEPPKQPACTELLISDCAL